MQLEVIVLDFMILARLYNYVHVCWQIRCLLQFQERIVVRGEGSTDDVMEDMKPSFLSKVPVQNSEHFGARS